MCCGLALSITSLMPLKVGVVALPSDTGKEKTCAPSEVTTIRSVWPSIVAMLAGPVAMSRVRLLSKTSPVPAVSPCTGRSIRIVACAGQYSASR